MILEIIERIKMYAETVGSTYGRDGKNVLITPKEGLPFFTRDGVTVAKYLPQDDPAANLLTQAAKYTVQNAGDGTTGTMLLIAYLLEQDWANVDQVRQYAVEIEKYLEERKVPVSDLDDLINVGTVAAHDKFYGEEVAKLVWQLGVDGVVRGEMGDQFETRIDPGYRLGSGALLPAFVDDTRNQMFMNVQKKGNTVLINNPLVLLIEEKIPNYEAILPIYASYRDSYSVQNGNQLIFTRPLVMIVGDFEKSALQFVRGNFMRGTPVFLVKSPKVGVERYDMLCDIKTLTDNERIYSTYESIAIKDFDGKFGSADLIELSRDECSIIKHGVDIEARKKEIRESNSTEEFKAERLSKLSAGIGMITYPSGSGAERVNIELILDDTVQACQGALEEGMQLGGRTLYLDLAKEFPFLQPTFEKMGVRLPVPSDPVYDSAKATKYMFRSAFKMVAQLLSTDQVVQYNSPIGEIEKR